MPARRWLLGAGGQSTVELVGLLPILVAVVLGAATLLAAGIADELADHAAQAGAMAILQDTDPRAAARESLPGWARDRLEVAVKGDRVDVTVDPPGPARATATAHAAARTAAATAAHAGAGTAAATAAHAAAGTAAAIAAHAGAGTAAATAAHAAARTVALTAVRPATLVPIGEA